ncbi:MAG: hypothetical protein ACT4P0_12390 [Panacagrimonas sp.]
MANGKEIAEISLKATSQTYIPGPANSTLVQVNFEGTSNHYGTVARTATFANAGAKSGTYSVSGVGYLDSGESVGGVAQGTFESIGVHKWRTSEVFLFSNGISVNFDAVLDLDSRSWIGKVFERL